MADGLRLALTTLTVAPVRGPAVPDRETAGRAMQWAPAVGLALGALAAAVLAGAAAAGAPLLGSALALAVLAGLTRGLHLDGLADLADGLGSYLPPEQARAVMKRPDVGALGLATVVLTLLVQVSALLSCQQHGRGPAALVLSVATGRLAVVAACRSTPAATPAGLGALVAGTVRGGATTGWGLLLAVGAVAALHGSPRPVAALGLALLCARLLRDHAVRRTGGLTGDVLGALVELATTVSLVVLAL